MTTITIILGVLILVCALFLVVSVLLQSSKNHRMSGVVSGGAETFFGKQKGKTIDAMLSKATAIIAALFAILVLALYLVNAHNQKSVVENLVNDNVITEQTQGTETSKEETENTETTETENTETAETETTETEGEAETEVSDEQ